jgi:hypothetical protein
MEPVLSSTILLWFAGYHSSSLSSSIATSESLSCSSSSLGRFVPLLAGEAASVASAPPGFNVAAGAAFVAGAAWPGTGALKMLCWRSVTSTWAADAVWGSLKVPSSLATTLDLDLA